MNVPTHPGHLSGAPSWPDLFRTEVTRNKQNHAGLQQGNALHALVEEGLALKLEPAHEIVRFHVVLLQRNVSGMGTGHVT